MSDLLFDRQEVQALLRKRVEGFSAGYRQNLAILGPEGMGKTTLLKHFLQNELPPSHQLMPIYLEVHGEENLVEWATRFVQTFLYAILQMQRQESFPARFPELLEVCHSLVPQTAALGKRILSLAEAGRSDEAYNQLWDLPQVATQETGHRVLLVLDEFHRLRCLSVREPFQSLGRRIMVQGTTMFLVLSSELGAARSILREGLALLFGQFETVEISALSAASCRKAIRSIWPEARSDAFLEYILMELAQGHPYRLSLLLEALRGEASTHSLVDPETFVLELLERLFLHPHSVLRQRFEVRLRSLPSHRSRTFCVQVLGVVAGGAHRLPHILEAVGRSPSQVTRALRVLQEAQLVIKRGIFHEIPERLFQLWMVTAHPVLQGVGLVGPEQARHTFREVTRIWLQGVQGAIRRPVVERVAELMRQWQDELTEIEGRRTLLPEFKEVEVVPGPGDRPSVLARRRAGKKGGWWVVPWTDPLDEGQARQLVQQLRHFLPFKEYRKVLIGIHPVEINARLVLQEGRIRLWDLQGFNSLLDLYGLTRLPVPEGVVEFSGQMVPMLEGVKTPQQRVPDSTEVVG